MSQAYWEAKIRGIIQLFNLNELQRLLSSNDEEYYWSKLQTVLNNSHFDSNIITLAEQIANASDRTIFDSLPITKNNSNDRIQVSHLLSGEKLTLSLAYSDYNNLLESTTSSPKNSESTNENEENIEIAELQELYWWLWRCLPQIVCKKLGNEDNFLLPASSILPDASIWSNASLISAIAGALTGYQTISEKPQTPYLATFSFTPIQEVIKASRKMRDFWAGSWVLHYLSAKTCWKLAQKYGPDTLIYPSLFQQPLIDHWLLKEKWQYFEDAIAPPSNRKILTAGFPNVIVILLPQDKVQGAMQMARETVIKEWLHLGDNVFDELATRRWNRQLQKDSQTWNQWLKYQWQTYWTALPLNNKKDSLNWKINGNPQDYQTWQNNLNQICQLNDSNQLFCPEEEEFINAVAQQNPDLEVNVGSWWCQGNCILFGINCT